MEMIASSQEALMTPRECAEEIGQKYELVEIKPITKGSR